MIQGHLRSWSTYLAGLVASLSLVACIQEAPKRAPLSTTPDDKSAIEETETSIDTLEPETNTDSGAFGKTASSSGSGIAPKKLCAGELKAGDLAVVEIMISSKSGSGDSGEWVEVKSTRDCWLKVGGVVVESPRGTTSTDSAVVDEGFELAPGGTFVVANSLDATKNHNLPGKVFSWDATDVLKNDGDTIIVRAGAVEIDKVTYPSLPLTPGAALAFPEECGDHKDFTRWVETTDSYDATFRGTPNAVNDDVVCPR
ncbi:MAG: hypothetical protein KIT84_23595 [Labilithrix sp.]|nr:hypothetical protein [Labilithrix sp.]MCW5814033.1 hypothetical protein [Labilithrix sp.]